MGQLEPILYEDIIIHKKVKYWELAISLQPDNK